MVLGRALEPRSKSQSMVKAGGDVSGCGLLQLNGFHVMMDDIDGSGDNTCLNSTATVTSPPGGSIASTIIETRTEDATENRLAAKRKSEMSPLLGCAQVEDENIKKVRLDTIKNDGTPLGSATETVLRAAQLSDESASSVAPSNGSGWSTDVCGTDRICDTSSMPLDLTASSAFCVGRHSTVNTNGTVADKTTQSSTNVSATADQPATQILLLNGKEYEIVPLGNGQWISKHEYELTAGLGSGKDQPELQQVVPNSVCESADVRCASPLFSSPNMTTSTDDDKLTLDVEHVYAKNASRDDTSSQEAESNSSEVVSEASNDAEEVGTSPLAKDGEQTTLEGERAEFTGVELCHELQRGQCNDETWPKLETTQSSSQHFQVTEDNQSNVITDVEIINAAENILVACNDGR